MELLNYNENLTLKDVMADIQFVSSSTSSSGVHNVSNNEVSTKISSNNTIIPAYDIAVEITNENNFGYAGDKLFNNSPEKSNK